MKTSANILAQTLGPRPGSMTQNSPKTTSLMMSLTKNPQPPTKNFFWSVD